MFVVPEIVHVGAYGLMYTHNLKIPALRIRVSSSLMTIRSLPLCQYRMALYTATVHELEAIKLRKEAVAHTVTAGRKVRCPLQTPEYSATDLDSTFRPTNRPAPKHDACRLP